jgi:hypothetical protein
MDQALKAENFATLSSAAREWAEEAAKLRAMDAAQAARRVQLAAGQGRKEDCLAPLERLRQAAAELLKKIHSRRQS